MTDKTTTPKVNRYSVAMPSEVDSDARGHLVRPDGQEDVCFGLWYPSYGMERTTALLHSLVLPNHGDRHVHGNASFEPRYFERALDIAVAEGAGLALLHSHPASGWQGMSPDDVDAESSHAAAAKGASGVPLLGLTLGAHDNAWSARHWQKMGPRTYERRWCENVRVVGDALGVTFYDSLLPRPELRPELRRTVSSWGEEAQSRLARLRIGVVGAGSVGSMIAEALARMGVARVDLFDFDGVEQVNLDRLLHATRWDALLGRAKVDVMARALRRSATAADFQVGAYEWSIVEEEGFRRALDCDLLFSCVDRPWPRFALNTIAYAHLIPVVDGGVFAEMTRRGDGLKRADWRAHVAAPGRRCLECLEQFDPGLVGTEKAGLLADPAYIQGLPERHPLRRNENVFAFSMGCASLEILQMLSLIIEPLGIGDVGAQTYHAVDGSLDTDRRGCEETCLYAHDLLARGDASGCVATGRHEAAENARSNRRAGTATLRYRALTAVESALEWFQEALTRRLLR